MLIDSLIETKRLNEIGLIVIDELHMIGDKSRGHNLELLLTKIMYLNTIKKCSIQIVGMSATIENMNEISQFLDAEVYTRNFRPVELKEYIKMEDNLISVNYKAKSVKETFQVERMNIGGDYDSRQRTRDPDHISALVYESIRIKSSCLIFCASKKSCENVALLLIDTLPSEVCKTSKSQRINLIENIKEDCNGKICPTLLKLIPYGIAYHHSGKKYIISKMNH
jgi:POLQ-like helicase